MSTSFLCWGHHRRTLHPRWGLKRAEQQNHVPHPPGCATFTGTLPATRHQHTRCQSAHRASLSCSCSYGIRTHSAQGDFCLLTSLDRYIQKTNSALPLPGFPQPPSLWRRTNRQVETCPDSSHFNVTREAAPVSHNHTVHYPASPTLWLSSCTFHAWLESYLYSHRTHYKLLKENGTQTYNNLTSGLTEGLAAHRGSVHSHGSNIYQGTDLAFICTHCCEALQHGLPAHKSLLGSELVERHLQSQLGFTQWKQNQQPAATAVRINRH